MSNFSGLWLQGLSLIVQHLIVGWFRARGQCPRLQGPDKEWGQGRGLSIGGFARRRRGPRHIVCCLQELDLPCPQGPQMSVTKYRK